MIDLQIPKYFYKIGSRMGSKAAEIQAGWFCPDSVSDLIICLA